MNLILPSLAKKEGKKRKDLPEELGNEGRSLASTHEVARRPLA